MSDLSSTSFEVRISNFGLSCQLENGREADTVCGTIEAIAPETFESTYDHRVDVWGVGAIFYTLLTN